MFAGKLTIDGVDEAHLAGICSVMGGFSNPFYSM